MSRIYIQFVFFIICLSILSLGVSGQSTGRGPGGIGRDFSRGGRENKPPSPEEKKEFEPGQHPERGPSFRFLSSEMRFGGKTVKGAPFTATSETISTRILGNGSKIENKSTATISRDSEGRTRREQSLKSIGSFAPSGEAPKLAFIDDPVAGKSYVLDLNRKTFNQRPAHKGGEPPVRPESPQSSKAKTESLGKQNIEGIEADGTRSTISIPVGEIGNDQALEIVTERWYSNELQEVILSKRSDPLQGNHTYRLTNIVRGEPAPSLFQPPADFTVSEGRGFGGPPRPMDRGKGEWKKDHDDEK